MANKRGSKKTKRKAPDEAANRLADFDRTLAAITPVTPGVFLILALSALLFVAMAVSAREPARPLPAETLKAWGANFGPLTRLNGGWRLFSAIFVHAWVVQLLFNAWALLDFGRFVERLLGSIGFVLVILVTGFCGNVASLLAQPESLVAGSSGAIFGLLGALAGFVLRFRSAFPPGALARLRKSVPAFIAFNVGYGLLVKDLPSADYLGGVLSGVVCGLLLARPLSVEAAPLRQRKNVALGLLAAVLVLGTGWALAPRTSVLQQQAVADLDERLSELYKAHLAEYNAKQLSQADFAETIEEQILPEWRKARSRLDSLKGVAPGDQSRWEDLKRYAKLRQQAFELVAEALRLGDDEALAAAQKKEAESARLADKLSDRKKEP